jgi:hypothetical protein
MSMLDKDPDPQVKWLGRRGEIGCLGGSEVVGAAKVGSLRVSESGVANGAKFDPNPRSGLGEGVFNDRAHVHGVQSPWVDQGAALRRS